MLGAVEFPLFQGSPEAEAAPEIAQWVLRYTTRDLKALEDTWKPDGKLFIVNINLRAPSGEFVGMEDVTYERVISAGLGVASPKVILDLLNRGLKKPDGKTKPSIAPSLFDDLPFNLRDAVPFINDALCRAWYGVSFADRQKQLQEEAESVISAATREAEAQGVQDPLASSAGSSANAAEPASIPSGSGI